MPVPSSWWYCWGSDWSHGRWEVWNIPLEQANPSHARGEVWLCRAGVRSTGVAAGQCHQICQSPEEQWADPQPCLRYDGTKLTLSRVMCAIY